MKEHPTTFWLSLVSGFVDTAGFIALGGIFTAHVTGNFVLAGASLARAETQGVASKLAMFPFFLLAVGLASFVARRLEGRGPLFVLLLLEAVFLALFAAGNGLLGAPPHSETRLALAGASGVIAMAIQNAYMRLHLASFAPTTVMTGNVTQFAIDLFGLWWAAPSVERRARLQKFGASLLGFFFGAIAGAVTVIRAGLPAALLPAMIVLLIALRARREGRPS